MQKKAKGFIMFVASLLIVPYVLEGGGNVLDEGYWYFKYSSFEQIPDDLFMQIVMVILLGLLALILFFKGIRNLLAKDDDQKSSAAPNRPNTHKAAQASHTSAAARSTQTRNPFEDAVNTHPSRPFGVKLWSDRERRSEKHLSFVEQERLRERRSMIEQGIYRKESENHWENEYFRNNAYDDCAASYSGVTDPKYHRHDEHTGS
ncbi:MAG: hypothetical protein Q4B57_02965 [Eubacteriales bacterium]|nr:hypothetical protein [Eubacteriales bacterium]